MERELQEGWDWKKLGDICEINPSVPFPSDFSPETKISFVPMACVDDLNGEIISAEHRPIGEIWNGYKRFADGDVLFARITPCMENGKSAIATGLLNGLGTGSTEFHILRPKKEILAKWIHYFVRQDGFLKEAAEGMTGTAGQQRLPKAFLENLKIPLPPLETQRWIVAILDKAEETRRLRAQADELAGQLIQSVFLEMFGDPAKNDKSWKIEKLKDLCINILGGGTPSKSKMEYYEGDIPWVTPKDMKQNFIRDSSDHISEKALNESSTKIIPPYSLLMVIRSGILKRTLPIAINLCDVTLKSGYESLCIR